MRTVVKSYEVLIILLHRSIQTVKCSLKSVTLCKFTAWCPDVLADKTAAWLAQLVERQSAVREVEGSSPGPDQHSGS